MLMAGHSLLWVTRNLLNGNDKFAGQYRTVLLPYVGRISQACKSDDVT
jgi:hypothetical protein